MKKQISCFLIFSLIFFIASANAVNLPGKTIFQRAKRAEAKSMYSEATKLYQKARKAFAAEGKIAREAEARRAVYKMERIVCQFPHLRAEAEAIISKKLPWIPAAKLKSYLDDPRRQTLLVDEKILYFEDFMKNILFQNTKLLRSLKNRDPFFDALQGIIFRLDNRCPTNKWQPYTNPHQYLATGELKISRNKLPKKGTLDLWIPLPIQTAAQTNVRVITITPDKYISVPPRTDTDLGLVFMQVPLKELKTDLYIKVQVVFTRYEEHFKVDPEKVGDYKKDSELYKRYTRSIENTTFNPEMKKLAAKIVGDEKNAYRAARRIYDYVIENISYSLMEHVRLAALGIPESVFCHEKGYGDCGTQSAYFSSLCRAAEIPARTTGGYQLVPGVAGTHFWAEFYLQNYGWLPVDVTIAETSDWTDSITEEERTRYKKFFFGSLDPYRLEMQVDIDVPLYPTPEDPVPLTMAIQNANAVCTTSEKDPAILVDNNWKWSFSQIK